MTKPPRRVGSEHALVIEALDGKGYGIGKIPDDSRPVRVPAAAPEDRGRVEIIHESPHQLVARWLDITPGPHRHASSCPHRPACGGCAAWEVRPDRLWQAKWSRTQQALGTLGSLLQRGHGPSPRGPWRSRHRAFVIRDGARVRFGVPEGHGPGLISIDHCPILPEPLRDRLQLLGSQLEAPPLQSVVSVVLTLGAEGVPDLASVGVGLRGIGPVPEERPGVGRSGDAVAWLQADDSRRSHFGGLHPPVAYSGPEAVAIRVGEVVLPTPPFAFVQVHPVGREQLLQTVLELLPDTPGFAVDAGCGTGLFARGLAQRGWNVLALDEGSGLGPAWIKAVERVEFRSQPAGARSWPSGLDLAICDPPRGGLDKGWQARLMDARPPHIVMVHCGLAAARRDLHGLAESGYRCVAIHPIDLMPGTMQVELVSAWERPDGEDSGSNGRR